MKKKSGKKTRTPRKTTYLHIHYIIVGVAVLALLLSGKIYSGISKTHVLGASTGPVLLADNGIDSGNQDGGGELGAKSSGGPGQTSSGNSGAGTLVGNTSQNGGVQSPSPDTQVACVGPDGKQFTTTFHDCQELNQHWGHTNFTFTPLGTLSQGVNTPSDGKDRPKPTGTEQNTPQGSLEVQTEGSKGELNLQNKGLQVEIKREDNGQVSIHAHQEGGQEVTLQTNDALDKINEALKGQEVEVGTASANELEIKSGSVSAHTTFPLSIDPATNTLAVTTPAGTKDVTVLPNEAVQNLLQSNILSSVLAQATGASGSATTTIGLTALNNQPVFQVQGVKDKHLFGIFPVAFQKTVTVSAQTGQVLSTQESLINSILEALSL